MKRLNISNGVYEKIRALCRDGGETEDQVLIRLLQRVGVDGGIVLSAGAAGFVDATYGIHFPEGFEISRTYKGRLYAARVAGGRWVLEGDMAGDMAGGSAYDSLNQLSQAVIDGNENAWMFWFFKGLDGTKRRIAELRDPAQVQKRPRRNRRRGVRGGVMPTPVVPPPMAPGAPGAAKTNPAPAPGPAPEARQRLVTRPAPALAAESPSPSPGPAAAGGMPWEPVPDPPDPKDG
ncbi:MAG: hypothetical protein V3U48_08485 [Rhodospirillales bacterium]